MKLSSLDSLNIDDFIDNSKLSLLDDTSEIQGIKSYEIIKPGYVYEWFKLPDFPLNNSPTNSVYRCFSTIEEIDIHSNFFR